MNKKILWITETAVMLALLICLQWVGGFIPMPLARQLITGTMVNCVLAVTVLVAGRSSGVAVALVSPVFAYLFKIAPVFTAVPMIMVGNLCYVLLLSLFLDKSRRPFWKQPVALATASVTKFAALYLLGVKLTCGLLFNTLNGKTFAGETLMNPKVMKQLMTMFAWPQLVTAIVGGILALLIVPTLCKALHKK